MIENIRGIIYQCSLFAGVMFTSTIESLDTGLKLLLLVLSCIFTTYKILELRYNRNKRLKD